MRVAEPFYSCGAFLKNWCFDSCLRRPNRAALPVISVGNLTTGGTGKTPTVAWLIHWLQSQGLRPGIVSRGYRSLDGQANDEKLLLDSLCPGVPHLQNRDRVAATRQIASDQVCDVIVLDDGFQHRRLHRDVDLVLIDALQPWGYHHLLPRGLLREPVSSLKRASAILLTRTDQASPPQLAEIQRRVESVTAAPFVHGHFETVCLVNSHGEAIPIESLRDRRMFAFAAIGNPAGFRRTLIGNGVSVDNDRFQTFPDHHHYSRRDLIQIEQSALRQNATCLLTTHKDLVKIDSPTIGGLPVWAIEIELKITRGGDAFAKILQSALR